THGRRAGSGAPSAPLREPQTSARVRFRTAGRLDARAPAPDNDKFATVPVWLACVGGIEHAPAAPSRRLREPDPLSFRRRLRRPAPPVRGPAAPGPRRVALGGLGVASAG